MSGIHGPGMTHGARRAASVAVRGGMVGCGGQKGSENCTGKKRHTVMEKSCYPMSDHQLHKATGPLVSHGRAGETASTPAGRCDTRVSAGDTRAGSHRQPLKAHGTRSEGQRCRQRLTAWCSSAQGYPDDDGDDAGPGGPWASAVQKRGVWGAQLRAWSATRALDVGISTRGGCWGLASGWSGLAGRRRTSSTASRDGSDAYRDPWGTGGCR